MAPSPPSTPPPPPPPGYDQPLSGAQVQLSIVEQTEAVIAGQGDSTTSTRHEASLQPTDLITPDATGDETPAPAYGESYGEIRAEKNGLATSAHVTDDGRVNIRINQLNRRLSQILTSASRQQLLKVEDSGPPPPPYIPPSLGGDGDSGIPPPPPLNVVIQIVGSRGDVQPFIALGKVLKHTYGHRVRIATHPTFRYFVEENGLEFFSIGGDPARLMAFMVKNPGLMPGFRSIVGGEIGERRKDVAEYIQGCWRSCYQAGNGMDLQRDEAVSIKDGTSFRSALKPFVADCIVANPPSFAHIHCAEKLGIPLHIMFTMPYSPTQAFPHPLANIQASNADPQMTNYMSYAMIEVLSWQSLGDIINRFRSKCLSLEPVSLTWAPGMLQRLRVPHTYCWSPALIPKPKDWSSHISISGFHFLETSNYVPSLDLETFLNAGPPPIYIGFGSIVLDNPDALTELIFEAARRSGQRVLLSKGWGGIGSDYVPSGVFVLGNVPHDWLFPRVKAVIHHGGAGTTAIGLRLARPTTIVPFFGDQPFWGAMVARSGAGPEPIPYRQLTASKLANAIEFCLRPETLECAKDLASQIATEGGNDTSAQSLHQFLEVDRLRCTLAPSRAAAWRLKRTQIRLSPFAACTLANANLLDFHDLKLFRAQEYEADDGPWDPISGGFIAACSAVGGMLGGLFEIPTETVKAVQLPFKNNREWSRVPVSATTTKGEVTNMGDRSRSNTSPGQIQSSSNMRESDESDSTSDSTLKRDSINQNRTPSLRSYSSGKDRDMLRHTGAHGSKGLGRLAKSLVQSPMDISVSMTKGLHNMPKLWGDETVRPHAQVSDFNSGARAAGKHFGLGFYDGISGLVTQPWNGARKEGISGFFKGIGKGVGGMSTKPMAGAMGLLGYTMKGVHREVQKMFSGNVQSYIVASRASQGYEEWLQSADAEKEDIIARWELVQKYLKQKRKPDEMVRDFVDAQQQKTSMEGRVARQSSERTTGSTQPTSATAPTLAHEDDILATTDPPAAPDLLYDGVADVLRIARKPVPSQARRDTDQAATITTTPPENVPPPPRHQQPRADREHDIEHLRQAIAASEAEAHRHAAAAMDYEEQLKQALERSLSEQTSSSSGAELESELGLNDEQDEAFERALASERSSSGSPKDEAAVAGASSHIQRHDPGYLEGITQSEFEAQQLRQPGEKTSLERMEEDIVMEYVKKQSLLEEELRNKGKGRAAE